jgi:DNA-binding LytR/AlgR family response regulator
MLHIAVCDDETSIGAELERALIDILGKLNIKHEVGVFFSSAEFIKAVETGSHFDLIFMDIAFSQEEINGVDVGRFIRDVRQNYLASIVYISWEKNYAMQLFDVQPLNFLVKPLQYEKIDKVIRKYLTVAGFMSGAFAYKIGHDHFKIPIKDIIYIESYDRKLIMRLSDGNDKEFFGALKTAYEEQLKRFDFLFIHNAYVVNYDYIYALKTDRVILLDGATSLPISKHRKNEVKENYFAILKRRAV